MAQDIEIIKKTKADKEEDLKRLQEAVSANLPQLTASALASALGATVVLKITPSETGKMKYVPVQIEEIPQALEWIAEYGNKFTNEDGGFFIIQQRPPDAKFWELMTNRHLGKQPDETKIDLTHKIDLATIGRKALLTQHEETKTTNYSELIPSTWM